MNLFIYFRPCHRSAENNDEEASEIAGFVSRQIIDGPQFLSQWSGILEHLESIVNCHKIKKEMKDGIETDEMPSGKKSIS